MDRNYHRLREALDKLPRYDAPANAWEAIETGLGAAEPDLSERLPTYAPPPDVWNGISQRLDRPPVVVHKLRPRRRWWRYAAAILLLLTAAFGYLSYDAGPKISYAYHQEAQPTSVTADWDDDEASFHRARQLVSERNEPQLNHLGYELDELSSAREEIKSMLVAYGDDPTVVRQLAEIERERDDVYRRILIEL
jgi:hypothetical protein